MPWRSPHGRPSRSHRNSSSTGSSDCPSEECLPNGLFFSVFRLLTGRCPRCGQQCRPTLFGSVRVTRSWTRRLLLITFALLVFPALLGGAAHAHAHGGTVLAAASGTGIDGIEWMNLRDSAGVPLQNYRFVTDGGGLLHPETTIISTILGLETIGYLIIVGTAIWLTGYALSFQWLDLFAVPLRGLAHTFTAQLATPAVLTTAATIGAFCAAWFWLRGYHAKAATQIVVMLMVAFLGPVFLAEPLAEVLSPNGLLAEGRDLGIAVAAGLTGDSRPHPAGIRSTVQGGLPDSFARNPLQVWNFGHLVDNSPACRNAWSAGITAGDNDRVRTGLRSCGDTTAYARSGDPSYGQIGTGLILLMCAAGLLAMAVMIAIRIMKSALDAVYHGFLTIFGFAAGGFIYGATQTHLIRSLTHSLIGAARMTLYTVFLTMYLLIISDLIAQARGHVLAVMVIAVFVEIIAISQLKHLNASLTRGNDWIAGRFALAVQNGMTRSGGGSGAGGSALGMGTVRASSGLAGMRAIATLGAVSTINSSPVTAWLAKRKMGPLNPYARQRQNTELINMAIAPLNQENAVWGAEGRLNLLEKARHRAGGKTTDLAAANVLDGLLDSRAPDALHAPVMLALGFTHTQIQNAHQALSAQSASKMAHLDGVPAAQKAVAAAYAARNYADTPARWSPIASQAAVAADNLARHTNAPVDTGLVDREFVNDVNEALASRNRAAALANIPIQRWQQASKDTKWYIGNTHALAHQKLAHQYYGALEGASLPAGHTVESLRQALFDSASKMADLGPLPWTH
ncbi:hypothetical protein ACFROC_00450 [Nocardia tengchongensis]|uniref:hypothetical protein n=1 Tax=Nocardia tengchongensis TaxID=2055889 RepID=UPI003674677D